MRMNNTIAHIGILPVFIMLVVFALIGFSALAVSSARADDAFADAYVRKNTAYYTSVSEAAVFKATTQDALRSLYLESDGDPDAYRAAAGDEISALFPCGDGQSLELVLRVLTPADEAGPYFEVISETLENEEVFSYDAPLHVFGADAP